MVLVLEKVSGAFIWWWMRTWWSHWAVISPLLLSLYKSGSLSDSQQFTHSTEGNYNLHVVAMHFRFCVKVKW